MERGLVRQTGALPNRAGAARKAALGAAGRARGRGNMGFACSHIIAVIKRTHRAGGRTGFGTGNTWLCILA